MEKKTKLLLILGLTASVVLFLLYPPEWFREWVSLGNNEKDAADTWNFNAEDDIEKGNIRLLVYGELMPDEDIQDSISKNYGFYFYRVAGCIIEDDIDAKADEYNKIMTEYLNKQNGSGWKDKFDNQVSKLNYMQEKKYYVDDNDTSIWFRNFRNKIIDKIRAMKKVTDEERITDSLSDGKRHLIYSCKKKNFENDKGVYKMYVTEDSGHYIHISFVFEIDSSSGKIVDSY